LIQIGAPHLLVDQQEMDAFALALVVAVQPLRINDGDGALVILGDDCLGAGFHRSASSDRFVRAWDSGITSLAGIATGGSLGLLGCTELRTP
jgi:hypothetical protein